MSDVGKIRRLAEEGDPEAQYELGLLYRNGRDAPENYDEAKEWFELAAEQGDAYKQYYIGMRNRGDGVPRDNEEAMRWFRLAAEQGHEGAKKALRKNIE